MTPTVSYRIDHGTEYVHAALTATSQHVAYLTPRTHAHQHVTWHELRIDPPAADRSTRTDYFGNVAEYFTVLTPYRHLSTVSRSRVTVSEPPPLDGEGSPAWEAVREQLRLGPPAAPIDAVEFAERSPYVEVGPEVHAFAR